MVLSLGFFTSTLLFSSISPDYESHLKEEIWDCHVYMNLSLDEIMRMPISDRKFYIRRHNGQQTKKKEEMAARKRNSSTSASLMNSVTRMAQQNNMNSGLS